MLGFGGLGFRVRNSMRSQQIVICFPLITSNMLIRYLGGLQTDHLLVFYVCVLARARATVHCKGDVQHRTHGETWSELAFDATTVQANPGVSANSYHLVNFLLHPVCSSK
jgi:hypothetical protein